MINLFSKIRVYISFLIFLALTGCTVPVKEELKTSENQAIRAFSENHLGSDETILHTESVHFHLRRWDSVGMVSGESSYRCGNDLLVVTSKRLYIVENYRPIEKYFMHKCSWHTGSSVLRPYKVYSYLLSSIKGIEIHDSYREIETEISMSFSAENSDFPTRIYLGLLDPVHATTSERKRISKARFGAINQNANITIRKADKCNWGVIDAHNCSSPPGGKIGPFWSCYSADKKPFQEKPMWLLYAKDGWHWYPNFEIPHQWCCIFRWDFEDCPSDIDLWSSNKEIATNLAGANDAHILYIGDERTSGSCFHKYPGFWSYKEYTINNCEEKWYKVGGRGSGPCNGMNGTKVRRYVVGNHNCYLYEKVDDLMTIDEYYGR